MKTQPSDTFPPPRPDERVAGWLMYNGLHGLFSILNRMRVLHWRVEGLAHLPPRPTGGMLLVMNHLAWFDIPILGTMLPPHYRPTWLTKAELFDTPQGAWFFRSMRAVPVQRGKRDVQALHRSVQLLRAGAVLAVFPEGTRSRNGGLQPAHSGAVRLAAQAGVPVVPIGIHGSEQSPTRLFQRGRVVVRIGTPYVIEAPTRGDRVRLNSKQTHMLTEDMMCRIAALLPPAYRGVYAAAVPTPEYPQVANKCQNVSAPG